MISSFWACSRFPFPQNWGRGQQPSLLSRRQYNNDDDDDDDDDDESLQSEARENESSPLYQLSFCVHASSQASRLQAHCLKGGKHRGSNALL